MSASSEGIDSSKNSFFKKMVDELIEFSEYDPELADSIKWLDGKAQDKGVTFYDMVFETLYIADVKSKAKTWLKDKIDKKPSNL